MKRIILKVINKIAYIKCSKKVTLLHKEVLFYRTTNISLTQGATKDNIVLDYKARIHGRLTACANGRIYFGKYSKIGPESLVGAVNKVEIGDYTAIARNVTIMDNNNHPVHPQDRLIMRQTPSGSKERSWIYSDNAPIKIGANCWIGENVRICKGVTIGDGAIVAANSVVTKDVPANAIAAGNPAKIVKTDIDATMKRYFDTKL